MLGGVNRPRDEFHLNTVSHTNRKCNMSKFVKQLLAGEEGATMVEYALMVALIAAAAVTAVKAVATAVNAQFNAVATTITPSAS